MPGEIGVLQDEALVELSREESFRLLATKSMGRVALSIRALPTVLPVRYILDHDAIVMRIEAGSKFEAAMQNAVVAFQVDQIDPVHHEGWSVVVVGTTKTITDGRVIQRIEGLALRFWSAKPGDTLVMIPADFLSGRRLSRTGRL